MSDYKDVVRAQAATVSDCAGQLNKSGERNLQTIAAALKATAVALKAIAGPAKHEGEPASPEPVLTDRSIEDPAPGPVKDDKAVTDL